MTPADLLLRYAHQVDRLSVATLRAIVGDLDEALALILADLKARDSDSLTARRLVALHGRLASLREALRQAIAARVGEATAAVADTASVAAVRAVAAGAGVAGRVVGDFALPPVSAILSASHDGASWARWGAKLADDVIARLTGELRQAVALGETVGDVRKRVERVAGLGRVSAERLARTSLNAVASAGQLATFRASGLVDRVVCSAVLDSRTSAICRSLDGQVFRIDDPDLPRPPRHPNCRSMLIPVIKGLPVPERLSYEDWLAGQPEAEQRDILGPARFRAWQRGLPLTAMATADRPLSVEALRGLYPNEMRDPA